MRDGRTRFNREQVALIAKTLADVAKLLFASSVIWFFIPGASGAVTLGIFLTGTVFAALFFWGGIAILKS
ncbi:MAG: hypothetical protein HY007_03655 [Candidatus Sungbacteria bacterium]|nr:hypothetical protein [Candidatus Sungbacteria bacterium]